MNVVLSGLIIILLLYPGIFFRAVYFRGSRLDGTYKIKYNVLRQPVWEQAIASIVPAFVIHIVCTQAVDRIPLLPGPVDYNFIYDCLLGRPINALNESGKPIGRQVPISQYLGGFGLYLIVSLLLALVSASATRSFVFRNKLDTKIPLLRFSNEWFYWLTGRILESGSASIVWPSWFAKLLTVLNRITLAQELAVEIETDSRTFDFISIHILAETKENTIIYDGVLYDFTLSETNNGLDRVVLSFASKSIFQKMMNSQKTIDKEPIGNKTTETVSQSEVFERADRWDIEQEFLIIPYSQIRNMTITYMKLQE